MGKKGDDGGDGEEMQSMKSPEPQPRSTSIYQNKEKSRKNERLMKRWRILAVLFMVLTVVLLVAVIVVAVTGKEGAETVQSQAEASTDSKKKDQPSICNPKVKTTSRTSIRGQKVFSGLSPQDTQEVIWFLMNSTDLRLTAAVNATLDLNYIYTIEDYLPNKREVTNYLDGKTSTQPTRRAKAVLFMGKKKTVEEYLVWPIPRPTHKQNVTLNRRDFDNKHLWRSRPVCNAVENKAVRKFLIDELKSAESIFITSFAPKCKVIENCTFFNIAPRVNLGSKDRHLLAWFFVTPDQIADYYLYPIPFSVVVSTPGNGNQFEIVKVYYNGEAFDTLSELSNKYYSDGNIHYKLPNLDTNRNAYGSPKYIKDESSADEIQRPPQQYSPDGARFSVTGTHVDWLGWTFDIHSRTITGMQLFDVKYKRERIAYELSMQDITVTYAGHAPDDYFKTYFDNGWSIGRYNLPLIRGVDCPHNALYLNSSIYGVSKDKGIVLNDTICVFEHRNSMPLRRHYSSDFLSWGYRYAFSMPDSVLIVRQILTLWNYDYIFDYEFHQNGLVEAKVSSTGYVAVSTGPSADDQRYGYVINPNWKAQANIHQHLFNFKFDLDIDGTENNFKTVDITQERLQKTDFSNNQPWSQMALQDTEIVKEKQAALRYDFSRPKFYVIYNADKQLYPNTQSAQPRGYRIQSNSFSKVMLPDEAPLMAGGASWAKYQLAVTQYNDSERTTASHYVQGDPFKATINFDDFQADDDSLDDVDLVAWVTVGLHHAPTYEDLPVTSTPGKTLTVSLVPFNYFKRDPSINSRDAAVFWNKAYNMTDDFLTKDSNVCQPINSEPKLNV